MSEHAGFFDAHQRATVEAAMARIIPTDDAPGAREARTIEFLDRYLFGPRGFADYLERCGGLERLQQLRQQEFLLHRKTV